MKKFLLFLFITCSLSAESQSLGKSRVDILRKSVVRILIEDTAVGTGFFVREDGWLLTCYHVIAPAISTKKNPDNTTTYNFKKTYAQFDNGEKVELGYSTFNLQKKFLESLQYDFFFLKTETKPKTKYIPLKLGKYRNLDLGDKVYTAGYPLGFSFLNTTTGETSSIIKENRWISSKPGDTLKFIRQGYFLDLTINGGNSGGPLVKLGKTPEEDLVVGIITYNLGPLGKSSELRDYYVKKIGIDRFKELKSAIKIDDMGELTNEDSFALLFDSMTNISIGIGGAISINYASLLLE